MNHNYTVLLCTTQYYFVLRRTAEYFRETETGRCTDRFGDPGSVWGPVVFFCSPFENIEFLIPAKGGALRGAPGNLKNPPN